MRWSGPDRKPAAAVALLGLLAALLLRAMVPSGYMVASGSDGGVRLTPCSVPAPAPRSSAADHGGHHATASQSTHHRPAAPAEDGETIPPAEVKCPYTALLAPPLPAAPPVLAPPASAPPVEASAVDTAPVEVAGLTSPPPPSTGPPRSA